MDGAPIGDDVDGSPLADLDGRPAEEMLPDDIDDFDGLPLSDDVDGTPSENATQSSLPGVAVLIAGGGHPHCPG